LRALEIETPRLQLRPLTLDDADDLHRIWTEPGVRKYLWDDELISPELVESTIQRSIDSFKTNDYGLWAVRTADQETLMGFCGFWFFHEPPKLELLYGLSEASWGQGLAAEAAIAMINFGFTELSFERIEASTDAGNAASTKVMQRAGMEFWKRENTNRLDTIYYAISRETFSK